MSETKLGLQVLRKCLTPTKITRIVLAANTSAIGRVSPPPPPELPVAGALPANGWLALAFVPPAIPDELLVLGAEPAGDAAVPTGPPPTLPVRGAVGLADEDPAAVAEEAALSVAPDFGNGVPLASRN